jgi:uncharacterized membrane protein
LAESAKDYLMDYQLAKDLFGMAAVITGWLVLFGVAVSGLVFVVAFVCWFIDKCRKEWDL